MSDTTLQVITAEQDPDLVHATRSRISAEWPEFMLHDPVADLLTECYDRLPGYQFVLTHSDFDVPVAIGNSIPLAWRNDPEHPPMRAGTGRSKRELTITLMTGSRTFSAPCRLLSFQNSAAKG